MDQLAVVVIATPVSEKHESCGLIRCGALVRVAIASGSPGQVVRE